MLSARKYGSQQPTLYATSSDFCQIFEKHMSRLYMLSFLLTADHSMAEASFVSGLEDSKNGNPVFKGWAESWARRMIIQNAIRMIQPRPAFSGAAPASVDPGADNATMAPIEISKILALPAFERFAFVMSVLEHYSDQECSLLLGTTRREMIAGRSRALQQISGPVELHRELETMGSYRESKHHQPAPIPIFSVALTRA